MTLYTRYCELYNTYRAATGAARQSAFEAVWRHAYRMRDRMMLSTAAICNRDRYRDRAMVIPEEAAWRVPEEKNPWKDGTPFTSEAITAMLQAGIASNPLVVLDFEPVAFGGELIPATALNLPTNAPQGSRPLTARGTRTYLTWLEQPGDLELEVTGGLIVGYRDRGNVKIRLFSDKEATLEAVAHDESVPPDGQKRTVTLTSPYAGLHTVEVSDGGDRTAVDVVGTRPLTIKAGIEDHPRLTARWTLYFYVPRGTTVIGGYTTALTGHMRDANGDHVHDFTKMPRIGYFSVPVPAGRDGAFWQLEQCSGDRLLMTVPPCLAPHPSRMLLPAEVVARDARR